MKKQQFNFKTNNKQYLRNIAGMLGFALLTIILSFCAPSTNNGGGGDGNGNSSGGGNGGNGGNVTTRTPSDVSNLRVSNINTSSLTFNWSNPTASATETFAGVYVQGMSGTTAPTNCNSRTAPTSGTRGTSHTINGLAEGTDYSIRVCSHTSGANPTISNGVTLTSTTVISGCPGAVGSLANTNISGTIHPTRIIDGRAGAGASYVTNLKPSNTSLSITPKNALNELGTVDYAFVFCGVPAGSVNIINYNVSSVISNLFSDILRMAIYYPVNTLLSNENIGVSTLNSINGFSNLLTFPNNVHNINILFFDSASSSARLWGKQHKIEVLPSTLIAVVLLVISHLIMLCSTLALVECKFFAIMHVYNTVF